MTAEDLLNAYRDEMAPTLGRAFIEGFIARNRNSMLRMLAPLVALMNERMQAPRVSTPRREEDPDEVTPEKDAIVWAAFRSLVNEKRRAFGMQELDEVTESMPFGGRSVGRIRDRGWGSEVAADKLTARRREMASTRHNAQMTGDHAAWSRRVSAKVGAVLAARKRGSKEAGLAAEASLARELGGKEHIPLAIETYRWEQEQEQRRIGRNEDVESLPAKLSAVEERLVGELVTMGMPRRDARSAVVQTRQHNVEKRLARMSPEEREEEHTRNAEMFQRVFGRNDESLPSRTPIAITLRHPKRHDLTAMVTASASEPGRFQLTWVDSEEPSGHTTRDTPEEAVRYAIDEGYRFDSANTAEAKEMVERVQQAREERVAEIDSWLTESLPRRRACSTRSIRDAEDRGRNAVYDANIADAGLTAAWRGMTESLPSRKTSSPRTAQQFIASFMRWEPHDHLYYELLELRPDATTREIEAKWGHSLKLTDSLNPRRPMYRDSSVTRQAYDVLTNPDWRRDYDANGNLDASFQSLRQRAMDATLTVASGDAMTDQDREVLLGVAEMGPEAYALHRNLRLPEVVAKTREILHEMDADDAKYRLPYKTESLPAPKHAGRMGDGFTVGEHVIRIGDMIKMEGQLGGYVENVDRSKGIARIEQDNGEIKTWPLASLLHDTAANRERQQEHNNQINAEAQARLERSLADWRAR